MSNERKPLLSDEQAFGDEGPFHRHFESDVRALNYVRDIYEAARARDAELRAANIERIMEVVLKWIYKSGEIDYNLLTSLLPEEKESGETKYVADLRTRLTSALNP